jgi:hypothetical protein
VNDLTHAVYVKAKCQRLELDEPEVLEELAAKTDLFTGSDLEGVVQEVGCWFS